MDNYTNFFLASAGACAALIGLLFVAISITPEGTVQSSAPKERQVVAGGAFTAFTNAFFVSLGALLPGELAYVAVVLSILALLSTLTLGRLLFVDIDGWLNLLRRIVMVMISLLAYGFECYYAVLLLQNPGAVTFIDSLAQVLLAIYGIGLVRSWQLLGARRYGFLGWLNPLQDTKPMDTATNDVTEPARQDNV
jgi:hypothetical protein